MKTSIVYLVIGLLLINSLSAQVKIGDNPQNLNPASLLELESTTRALVITRVNDAQMSTINPLRGAVVYNTDKECLHYFNGSAWINICEALDDSFTVSTRADSLRQVNPQARENTIAILQSTNPDGSTNYNFEVYRITGANIVDTSINADSKLQDGTVTRRKLAEDAVGLSNLADASSAGDLYMYNGSAWNFVNRADLLNTQLDSIVGNEVVGPFDTTLRLEGDGDEINPYTLDVSEGGITAFEIDTGAVTTDEILNETILTEDLATDAVTTIKIANANVTNDKLDKGNIPLSGFGAAAADVDLGTNRILNVVDPTDPQDAATKNYVDAEVGSINSLTDANIYVGDATNTAQEVTMSGDATMDNTGALTIQPNAVTNIKLDKGNIPLSGFAAAAADVDLGANRILNVVDPTDPQDAATKNYVDAEVGSINSLTDANIYVGDATNTAQEVTMSGDATMDNTGALTIQPEAVTPAKIEPSLTNGQVLTTVAGATSWQPPAVVAMGKVNGDGTPIKVSTGVTTVLNTPNLGSYTVSFAARIDADYIVQLTVLNNTAGYSIQVTNQTDSSFDVQVLDEFGNDQNSVWYFTITDF